MLPSAGSARLGHACSAAVQGWLLASLHSCPPTSTGSPCPPVDVVLLGVRAGQEEVGHGGALVGAEGVHARSLRGDRRRWAEGCKGLPGAAMGLQAAAPSRSLSTGTQCCKALRRAGQPLLHPHACRARLPAGHHPCMPHAVLSTHCETAALCPPPTSRYRLCAILTTLCHLRVRSLADGNSRRTCSPAISTGRIRPAQRLASWQPWTAGAAGTCKRTPPLHRSATSQALVSTASSPGGRSPPQYPHSSWACKGRRGSARTARGLGGHSRQGGEVSIRAALPEACKGQRGQHALHSRGHKSLGRSGECTRSMECSVSMCSNNRWAVVARAAGNASPHHIPSATSR